MKSKTTRLIRRLMVGFLTMGLIVCLLGRLVASSLTSSAESASRTTIFVGDSRTVDFYNALHDTAYRSITRNEGTDIWSARWAATYDWLVKTGAPQVESAIGKNTDVVILMGYNDLKTTTNLTKSARHYAKWLNRKATAWGERGATVYYASVTPVGTDRAAITGSAEKVTNPRIQRWNSLMQMYLEPQVHYLDLYDRIEHQFYTRTDHTHYAPDTSKVLYNIVKNKTGGTHDLVFARDSTGQWGMLESGTLRTDYTGLCTNQFGTFLVTNGRVDFSYTGIYPWAGEWWMIENGAWSDSYSGIARNASGWWKVQDGKVDFTYTGIEQNVNGWWRVENGKVNFTFQGLAQNRYGWWKFTDGKVDFSYTGSYQTEQGNTLEITDGKVQM